MRHRRVCQSTVVRCFIILGFLIANFGAGVGLHAVAAQSSDDTEYELETTGDDITWDDPWAIEPDITSVDDGFEIVGFTSDTSSLLISVIPNELDLEEARDVTLEGISGEADSFTIVDRGAYDNISYALDIAAYDDAELGVFTLFRGGSGDTPTFVYVFIGGIASFSEGFASAQETFRIGGETIFDGVEGQGLEDQLVAISGGSQNPPATEESTDDPTEEPEEDPTEESTTRDRDDQIDEEYIDAGVVAQGEYESPQFGSSLTWDDNWAVDVEANTPAASNEDDAADIVSLVWNGRSPAFITVNLLPGGEVTPADFVEVWTSDEFLADSASQDVEVLLSDSGRDIGGVVVRDVLEGGGDVVVYREAHVLDDGETIALITYFSGPNALPDALDDAATGIELDGEPILEFFDPQDIADEFE